MASANGRFIGDKEKELYGIGRLNSLMNSKYFSVEKNDNLLIQCSSFGVSKQKNFYSNLYKRFNLNNYEKLNDTNNIDIFYPSVKYIQNCEKWEELCSCLFFNKECYKMHKDRIHDIVLKDKYKDRETVFHSKIFITGKRNKSGKFILNNDSFIYIGSHNFSSSAWGNYEKNDTQISIDIKIIIFYLISIVRDIQIMIFHLFLIIFKLNIIFLKFTFIIIIYS